MGKILQEFKTFAMRGNVIDMAVGVIIGGAFGKIVSSLVADVIMPLVGLLVGGINFSQLKWTIKPAVMDGDAVVSPEVSLNYGNFIQVTFDFLIIAVSVFLMVKAINTLSKKKKEELKEAKRYRLEHKAANDTLCLLCFSMCLFFPSSAECLVQMNHRNLFVTDGVAEADLGFKVSTLGIQQVHVCDDTVHVLQLRQVERTL